MNKRHFRKSIDNAKASANLYGVIETAKPSGLEPFTYLQCVFKKLPAADSIEALGAINAHKY